MGEIFPQNDFYLFDLTSFISRSLEVVFCWYLMLIFLIILNKLKKISSLSAQGEKHLNQTCTASMSNGVLLWYRGAKSTIRGRKVKFMHNSSKTVVI